MHSVMAQPFDAPREKLQQRVWLGVRAVLRLIVPVLTLLVILSAAYIFKGDFVTRLDVFPTHLWRWNPGYWLSAGHLVLPLAFFSANLTNRRFGASYAISQVIVTWVILGLSVVMVMYRFGDWGSDSPFPPAQVSLAFVVAFGLAQLVNVNVFEKTRGRTWWGAPLISMVWASAVYVIIFHPVANWGTNEPWMPKMVADFVIKSGEAVLLLLPYHLLRRSIRPLPGYGGA